MSETSDESTLEEARESGAWRMLVRSFATLAIGETLARVFGLAAIVLLARNLGPAGYGVVAVGIALVGRLAVVSDSGTELLTVRDVAREPQRFRELSEKILGLRLALSVAVAIPFVAGVYAFVDSSTERSVYLRFALALPAMALNLRWIALGVRRERAAAAGNVLARGAFLLGLALFVLPSSALGRVPFAYAASELVYAGAMLVAIAPEYGLLRPRVDLRYWGATLRQSLPLLVSSLARGLSALDLVIVTAFASSREAGLYSAGARPMFFVATILSLFYVTFVASYSSATRSEELGLLRRSVGISLGASVLVAVVLTALAASAVPFVFGSKYASAAPVAAILAWKLPFSAVSAAFNGVLVSAGRQALLMRNNVAGGVLNLLGDLVAMPLFGIKGVAVVSVLVGATVLLLNYRAAWRERLAPGPGVLVTGAA